MSLFLGAPEGMAQYIEEMGEACVELESYVSQVRAHSGQLRNIVAGNDSRKILLTGPCSIHHPEVSRQVIDAIAVLQEEFKDAFKFIVRLFGEKPRSANLDKQDQLNFRGFIAHPDFGVKTRQDVVTTDKGIAVMRDLMMYALDRNLAVGTEFLSSVNAALLGPLVSYVQIGARSVQADYIDRHLSQMEHISKHTNCIAGVKNSENGDLALAIRTMHKLEVLNGRDASMLIMRGNVSGPNYTQDPNVGVASSVPYMIDSGHDNCKVDGVKSDTESMRVFEEVLSSGRLQTDKNLVGVTIESHILPGCQNAEVDLELAQSLTDPCVSVESLNLLLSKHRHK